MKGYKMRAISLSFLYLTLSMSVAFGYEWEKVSLPENSSVISIASAGGYQFVLVQETSTIYRRSADSEDWVAVFTGDYAPAIRMMCLGERIYYVKNERTFEYYYSDDYGESWQVSEKGIRQSVFTGKTVKMGDTYINAGGIIQVSDDKGVSWRQIGSLITQSISVGANGVYVGGWGFISYSLDSGATWGYLSEGLPERERVTAVGEIGDSVLIASTEQALYRSMDGGRSWEVHDRSVSVRINYTNVSHFISLNGMHYLNTGTAIFRLNDKGEVVGELDTGFRNGRPLYGGISVFNDALYTSGYNGLHRYCEEVDIWDHVGGIPSGPQRAIRGYHDGENLFAVVESGFDDFYTREPLWTSVYADYSNSSDWSLVLDADYVVRWFSAVGERYYVYGIIPGAMSWHHHGFSDNRGEDWEFTIRNRWVNEVTVSPDLHFFYNDTLYLNHGSNILISTDTLTSWDTLHTASYNIQNLYKLGERIVYEYYHVIPHAGLRNGIFISDDNGETFQKLDHSSMPYYGSLLYSSEKLYSVHKSEKNILISADSGSTWTEFEYDSEQRISELLFASHGVLFGRAVNSGAIFYSVDDGKEWQLFTDPLGNTINFFNENLTLSNDMLFLRTNGELYALSPASLGYVSVRGGMRSRSDPFQSARVRVSGRTLSVELSLLSGRLTDYTITLYDLKGAAVKRNSGIMTTDQNRIQINLSGLARGTYIYRLNAGDQQISGRVIMK
ncbi:BNR/Asp-box repeat-containing protein [Chitinispirillum alkaliphilum]|nr:BNR/Asp-box repeat-containing protein [Chitinispirillum alkaliphilum]